MGRLIDVDIRRLDIESNNLKDKITEIDREVAAMVTAITELSGMWKGPANTIFNAQFAHDKEIFDGVSKEVTECVQSMQEAVKLYRKCEANNESTVNAIKVD